MGDIENVKRLVNYYARLYKTRDPFELADRLGVLYQVGNLSAAGCYMFLKNHRYIFLSNQLEGTEKALVMAHELGHAVLDRKANCYFIRNHTLLLNSRLERRANLFAAHLLITDDLLKEYAGYTGEQFCAGTGFPEEILSLRLL